jgi:hypothetical protein
MLNLTHAIDKATGYVFVPPPKSEQLPGTIEETNAGPSQRPNTYALFSSAIGPMKGPASDVRDVQERWIDAKEDWDAFEKKEWRKEGEAVREQAARKSKIRERKAPSTTNA